MRLPDVTNYADPLDVLHRFIPTPLKAVYRISSIRVMVETNDFTLLPELPLDSSLDRNEQYLQWKLVRDLDSRGLLEEPIVLASGNLTVVAMGNACLLGLDHERRELFGFIGADIDARTHQEFLVPFLCRLSNEVPRNDSVSNFSGFLEGSGND
jgi:hypothetical protein